MTDRVTVAGRPLAFTDTGGTGSTLVFLHMFGGSIRTWASVVDRLAGERRCIAIDLPGFGDSEPLADPGVAATARVLRDFLGALGVDRCTVLGHSMGGKLAMALAARDPGRVDGLILVEPSPLEPEPTKPDKQAKTLAAWGDPAAVAALIDGLPRRPIDASLRGQLLEDHLRSARIAWDWWVRQGSQEDLRGLAPLIRARALVIRGGDDPVFDLAIHRRLADSLPRGEIESLRGVGHLAPLEAPGDLAECIGRHAA